MRLSYWNQDITYVCYARSMSTCLFCDWERLVERNRGRDRPRIPADMQRRRRRWWHCRKSVVAAGPHSPSRNKASQVKKREGERMEKRVQQLQLEKSPVTVASQVMCRRRKRIQQQLSRVISSTAAVSQWRKERGRRRRWCSGCSRCGSSSSIKSQQSQEWRRSSRRRYYCSHSSSKWNSRDRKSVV